MAPLQGLQGLNGGFVGIPGGQGLTGGAAGTGIRVTDSGITNLAGSPANGPIRFAGDMIRKHVIQGKPVNLEGVIDSGIRAAHPALLVIDAASQQFGGPSLQRAFVQGVNATGTPRVPPLPF